MNCGHTNGMKVWSSRLWLQFKQPQLSPKNVFGAPTGFKPMASALALQCSTNWAMKTHTLGAGQFVEFIVPVKGMKHMNIMWTADIQMKWRCDHHNCDDHTFISKLIAIGLIVNPVDHQYEIWNAWGTTGGTFPLESSRFSKYKSFKVTTLQNHVQRFHHLSHYFR